MTSAEPDPTAAVDHADTAAARRDGTLNRIRRFVHTTPLRRVLLGHRMRRVLGRIASLRFVPAAWSVRRPFRFLAMDVRRRGMTVHRLRSTGSPVVVDHGNGALVLLDEIFGDRCYEPPAPLAELVPAAPRILDLGANVGVFCAYALDRWPECTITAVEADPANVAGLERLVGERGDARIEVVSGVAANHTGSVRFRTGLGSGSAIDDDGLPLTAVDVLPLLAGVDLVKMDIERGEWPILADPRLSEGGPIVLVMEYHRRFVDDPDAAREATRLLVDAGFEVGFIRPVYWGHGTLWAWRT